MDAAELGESCAGGVYPQVQHDGPQGPRDWRPCAGYRQECVIA